MALERIVRPFVAGSPFSARRLPPVPPTEEPEAPEPVVWGKEIGTEYTPFVNTFTGWQKQDTEVSRKTSTVRVFQNNDQSSSNWVDVERIDQLRMRRNSGEEYDMIFNNPAS
jgi:hypothetical protein